MDASSSELVFPNESGGMRSEGCNALLVLRRTLGWAGLVDGYEHSCRRCKGRGTKYVEQHPDSERRRCPQCQMLLWVSPLPRKMRFHDLRHTTATLLLRAGVDVVRVQRILRHSDVRLTADTYGHLVVEDLRDAVNTIAPTETAEPDASVTTGQPRPDATQLGSRSTKGPDTKDEGVERDMHRARGKMLSVREVAERLGVCAATVYRLCATDDLANSRVGSSIRVSELDLERLLGRGGRGTGKGAPPAVAHPPSARPRSRRWDRLLTLC
jgi:excisionase family DNA binding protein